MEPISLAAGTLGATFLAEGVKFLWHQAGEIIKRYHEKKQIGKGEIEINNQALATIDDPVPEFIALSPVRSINYSLVEKRLDELKNLRRELSIYALGDEEINPKDENMLDYVDQLQQMLSEIFAEDVDVPQIRVQQFLENIGKEADVKGVEAHTMVKGAVDVDQRAKNVEGKLTAVRLQKFGDE